MTPVEAASTVYLVDDDAAVLKALTRVLRSDGWRVQPFTSAEAFLEHRDKDAHGCLVLDVNLPGLDGLELQRRLAEGGSVTPVIFVSGHGDIPTSVRAIKAGAGDFLSKPVRAEQLLSAVRSAIEQDALARSARRATEDLQQRFAELTSREREVLAALVTGKLNKQIAADLGVVEQTVKFHRARIMQRMQARSVAELMFIAAQLGITRGE